MFKSLTLNLIEKYFQHRWLNLLPLLILIIASGVYLVVLKPTYTAQGALYVNSQSLLASLTSLNNNNNNIWITPAQSTSSEIIELMKTDAFVRAIIQQTDLEKEMDEGNAIVGEVIIDVRDHVGVVAAGNNQIQISASNSNPVIAYQLVNSLLENYIQWKMNSKKTETQSALDFFSALIAEYKTALDQARTDLKTYIGEHPEPIRGNRPYLEQFEIDRLNGQIKASESRYSAALDKEENAKLSLQQIVSDTRQTYLLIDAPTIPTKSSISMKKLAVSLAIFWAVGLFLTIALVVGSYLTDRTVRFAMDVTTQLNLPVLAMIPKISAPKDNNKPRLKSGSKKSKALSSKAENSVDELDDDLAAE